MKKISHKISVDAFNKAFAFYNSESEIRRKRGIIDLCKLFALKNQHGSLKPKQVKKIEFKLTNKDGLSINFIRTPNQIQFYLKEGELDLYDEVENNSEAGEEYSLIPHEVEKLSDINRKRIDLKLFFTDLVEDQMEEEKDDQGLLDDFDAMSVNPTLQGSVHSMNLLGGDDPNAPNQAILIQGLEQQVANLTAQLEQRNNDIVQKDMLINQNANNVTNLQTQVTTQTNLYNNTNTQLQNMTQQYNTANTNYTNVNNQLAQKNTQINTLNTQVQQANNQRNAAQVQVNQANTQRQALQNQVNQLQGQVGGNANIRVFRLNGQPPALGVVMNNYFDVEGYRVQLLNGAMNLHIG